MSLEFYLKSFNGVSRKFYGCLKFQGGFKEVSRMSQGSFKGIYKKCQRCFKEVLRVFQGTFKSVSTKIEGCFKEVSRMSQGSFKGV